MRKAYPFRVDPVNPIRQFGPQDRRVLELQPSLHWARRDLAMIYAETGDIDKATNRLIEVLREEY